jgi:hypothetical protein
MVKIRGELGIFGWGAGDVANKVPLVFFFSLLSWGEVLGIMAPK